LGRKKIMVNQNLILAIDELQKEKGIKKEVVISALEDALASAYRKNYGKDKRFEVEVNPKTGEIRLFDVKEVVDDEEFEENPGELKLSDAIEMDSNLKVGDKIIKEVIPDRTASRIAAQTAKQVIVQKIKEAEKELIYDEYKNMTNTIVQGVVRRFENRNVVLELNGKAEILLPLSEQIPRERFRAGDRVKTIITSVEKIGRGPSIIASRTSPLFVKKLFEQEIPELQDDTIEIKSVSRIPGFRSKVAVASKKDKVDPVGSCVGYRGSRIQVIISELKGEKIDIVKWNDDLEIYISNAFSPTKLISMKIMGETDGRKQVQAIVSDEHYGQLIGRDGQNIKLISELIGVDLEILSEREYKENIEKSLFNENEPEADEKE
jgi:N utilization substance protein A